MKADRRASAFREHTAEWERRRERGRQWLIETADPAIPELPPGIPGFNAIDRFLAGRLIVKEEPSLTQTKRTVDFPKQVRPILEAKARHRGGDADRG